MNTTVHNDHYLLLAFVAGKPTLCGVYSSYKNAERQARKVGLLNVAGSSFNIQRVTSVFDHVDGTLSLGYTTWATGQQTLVLRKTVPTDATNELPVNIIDPTW